jgi:hypothetical protein
LVLAASVPTRTGLCGDPHRHYRMEHHDPGFDFTGYFRFLAKHGYVKLAAT